MPTEAKANLILDAIKARLDLITGGPTYNTNPSKQVGVPRDPIPEGSGERVYLEHVRTDQLDAGTGDVHRASALYHVWCVSGDPIGGARKARNLGADVIQAITTGEAAIQAAGATYLAYPGEFVRDVDSERAIGAAAYYLAITAEYEYQHSAP